MSNIIGCYDLKQILYAEKDYNFV